MRGHGKYIILTFPLPPPPPSSAQGVLGGVIPQVRQLFERLPAGPLADAADTRFEHFKKAVWPRIREAGRGGGQLVYIPSYFDYVRWGWGRGGGGLMVRGSGTVWGFGGSLW